MDYRRIYDEFMADRRYKAAELITSGLYYEKHHIEPRFLGGGDEDENLVALTAREHIMAHAILAKALDQDPGASERIRRVAWMTVVFMTGGSDNWGSNPLKKFHVKARFSGTIREAGRAKLKGANHPLFNAEEITLFHRDGRMVKGTRQELIGQGALSAKALSSLIHGQKRSYNGWALDAAYAKIAGRGRSNDQVLIFWHPENGPLQGTRKQMREWGFGPQPLADLMTLRNGPLTCRMGYYASEEAARLSKTTTARQDGTRYVWIDWTGRIVIGTRSEFKAASGATNAGITGHLTGRALSVRGWKSLGPEPEVDIETITEDDLPKPWKGQPRDLESMAQQSADGQRQRNSSRGNLQKAASIIEAPSAKETKMRRQHEDSFLKKARKLHGDRYDYSLVAYRSSKEKVEILCPEHGAFWMRPNAHLNGSGCPCCGVRRSSNVKKSNTESFIEKARAKHGDRYDYSKVEYKASKEKVEIICRAHGSFWQMPNGHLNMQGCPECGKRLQGAATKITREEFVSRSREKHNDAYSYDSVDFQGREIPVNISCPTHGVFRQSPRRHLHEGAGCPGCAREARDLDKKAAIQTQKNEDFIKRAREVHGDDYDYSLVAFSNMTAPVQIRCPKHGCFTQRPKNHLKGNGCKTCGLERNARRSRLTQQDFVAKAREAHGSEYDYSQAQYQRSDTKISILCSIHGLFKQTPASHLSGQGCPKCGKGKITGRSAMTTEDFVKKARVVHGDRYDYSRVEYISATKKVEIVCRTHGVFCQQAHSHTRGSGCPECVGRKRR